MRRTSLALLGAATAASICLVPAIASAATYQVGPSRSIQQLEELSESLQPGDVVELDGDATYTGDVWMEAWGTQAAPVTIRGMTVNGKRPTIAGGDYSFIVRGGHYVIENIDVTGGSEVCLFHKAQNMVVRDSVVHDCPQHGILGADWDTGSLILERVEVARSGMGIYKHPVYVATDETTYPGSVFRMEGCYVHSSTGGNNVKSRAERVELYGNWIEGAMYHELDLIGTQEHDPGIVREDSDVVGNVFIKKAGNEYTIARVGGDGVGDTQGRHRFANNTMILSDATSYGFRLAGQLESFELHNNVIVGNGATQLWREEYAGTMTVSGSNNWMSESITMIDGRITGIRGTDPGFANLGGNDFRPSASSALVDAATASPASPPGLAVPGAQGVPALLPMWPGVQASQVRNQVGGLDIGAFELGSEPGGGSESSSAAGGQDPTTTSGGATSGGATSGGATGGGDSGTGDDGTGDDGDDDDGTDPVGGDEDGGATDGDGNLDNVPSCSVGIPNGGNAGLLLTALGALGLVASRRRRS